MALDPPSIGALRHSVTFQRRGSQANVAGVVQASSWSDLGASCSASLTATTGGEQIIGGRIDGQAVYDLWVRASALTRSVVVGDRVVDARNSARIFDIRFISDPDGRRRWLFMQVVNNGVPG